MKAGLPARTVVAELGACWVNWTDPRTLLWPPGSWPPHFSGEEFRLTRPEFVAGDGAIQGGATVG